MFKKQMQSELNGTTTTNGANALKSTLNDNLDYFYFAGGSRNSPERASEVFGLAIDEDLEVALRNLVHARNVRLGGIGERDVFRHSVIRLEDNVLIELLPYIEHFGRWDDVVYIYDKSKSKAVKKACIDLINTQLNADMENLSKGESISLLAKWLPSKDSSANAKRLADELAKQLFTNYPSQSQKAYRKVVSALRKELNLVETNLTNRDYDKIDIEKLPALARNKYSTVLWTKKGDEFQALVDRVNDKDDSFKFKQSGVTPDQIIHKIINNQSNEALLEAEWKSLEETFEFNEDSNSLVVADTSGSMTWDGGKPIEVAIGLALYFSERMKGQFKNSFVTFSDEPSLIEISTSYSLKEKVRKILRSPWGSSTNVEAVFDLVLDTAVNNNVPQKDLPNQIIIVSDMQFNGCVKTNESNGRWNYYEDDERNQKFNTLFEKMSKKFESKGYTLPTVIFWNVKGNSNVPVDSSMKNVSLVSGFTPNLMESILLIDKDDFSPISIMKKTLFKESYDFVTEIISNSNKK